MVIILFEGISGSCSQHWQELYENAVQGRTISTMVLPMVFVNSATTVQPLGFGQMN
jgi:hypothetical protein